LFFCRFPARSEFHSIEVETRVLAEAKGRYCCLQSWYVGALRRVLSAPRSQRTVIAVIGLFVQYYLVYDISLYMIALP
jgi:hypothetical protein